ncbi:MAG: DNA polymerase/3'-5' exonuclease PolX [Firmicutes bacterium]|nr:DNA polymerase/3'-5' exonuclease PolX [Bacillota bacterium]
MTNLALARAFFEIADLMDLNGDNPFRANAYRKAARAIEALPEDIRSVYERGEVRDIPGIGPVLSEKIDEWLHTQRIQYLEELRQAVPSGVVELTKIAGVGSRLARRFYTELGVSSIDQLETACRKRRVRTLKGLGARMEWNILRGIQAWRDRGDQIPLGVALPVARSIQSHLEVLPSVKQVKLAGGVRRRQESVDQLEMVIASPEPLVVLEALSEFAEVREVLETKGSKGSFKLKSGPRLEVLVVAPENFWWSLWKATGSPEHIAHMQALASEQGLPVSNAGIWSSGVGFAPNTEAALYESVGLPYIPPEIREGKGEVQAAAEGRLPKLVELADMRGDLHCHTRWSDGVLTLEEVALAAAAKGYEYVAICDHSQSLTVANGLTAERLRAQARKIRLLNEKLEKVRLLSGIEVDILGDGSLDLPDSVLAERDIVVASIHSGFRQDREQLTARILNAMQNPYVDIIGHPTGRLLGRREPYAIDMEQAIKMAAKTGTVLEINASPDRLDINDVYAAEARSAGVKIAVNTDAHSQIEYDNMHLGIGVARRAWLTTEHVLNAWSWADIQDYLSDR